MNPIAVDIVATRLMGFDPLLIKTYASLLQDRIYDFGIHDWNDIRVLSTDDTYVSCLFDTKNSFLAYEPHPGWKGHIEVNRQNIESII